MASQKRFGRCRISRRKRSRKSGWKLNGTRPFWLFQWKISGSDGTSKMVVVLPFGDLQTAIRVPFLQSHL